MSSLAALNSEMSSKTWSLTVGNGGENHTGMEFLGSLRRQGQGWDIDRLRYGKRILEDIFGKQVDLYNLNGLHTQLKQGFYQSDIKMNHHLFHHLMAIPLSVQQDLQKNFLPLFPIPL